MTILYLSSTIISVIMLVLLLTLFKKKDINFVSIFISVLLINLGYLIISISKTTDIALIGNKISYLGSVCLLPLMLSIILETFGKQLKKPFKIIIPIVCAVVYVITATPGINTWYYKSVELQIQNGSSMLIKEYGPLHNIYFLYVIIYFLIMIVVTLANFIKNQHLSHIKTFSLLIAVFGNIAVYGIEQVIHTEYEFLSLSYVVSEMFLLMLYSTYDNSGFVLKPKQLIEPQQNVVDYKALFEKSKGSRSAN